MLACDATEDRSSTTWAEEEEYLLEILVKFQKAKSWNGVSKLIHGRTAKECEERWQHLSPDTPDVFSEKEVSEEKDESNTDSEDEKCSRANTRKKWVGVYPQSSGRWRGTVLLFVHFAERHAYVLTFSLCSAIPN